ncbi:MAG: NADH-quinone oxidoreductase subunit J [Deinococcales bacterium]|nr:NADH-quinone oxidoreductase subunit J [Deinococcales bacterium]
MVAFIVLGALLLAAGVGVVTLRQPVHAALSLVGGILALAAMYVTLEAHFLAAIQVIVYAGAVMVLFLFVIMLLNVGSTPTRSLPWLKPVAWVTGLLAVAGVAAVVFMVQRPLPELEVVQAALRGGNADAIGESLFSDYLLAFHLVGVLLLVGILGAVALVQQAAPETRAVATRTATPDGEGAEPRPVLAGEES